MYIAKVLSNLGAWEKIQRDYPAEFEDISNAIKTVSIPDKIIEDSGNGRLKISRKVREVGSEISSNLESLGWKSRLFIFGKETDKGFSNIEVVKSGVGLEALTGKFAYAESDIFVKFPMFIRSGIVELGVIIVLTKSLTPTGSGMSNFEMIQRRMKQITPYMPKYPFVVIGISNKHSEIQFDELSSDLDGSLRFCVGAPHIGVAPKQRHDSLQGQDKGAGKEL